VAWVPIVASLAATAYKAYQDSQNNDKVAAAGQDKLRNLREATGILEQQRRQRTQTSMNALANQMGAYQGANNVLASMYGPRGSMAPNLSLDPGGGPRMAGGAPAPMAPPGGSLADIGKMFAGGQMVPGGGKGPVQPVPGGVAGRPGGGPLVDATQSVNTQPGLGGRGLVAPPPLPPTAGENTGIAGRPGGGPLVDTAGGVAQPIAAQRAGTLLGGQTLPPGFGLNQVGKLFSGGGTPTNPGGGGTPIIYNPGGDLV